MSQIYQDLGIFAWLRLHVEQLPPETGYTREHN